MIAAGDCAIRPISAFFLRCLFRSPAVYLAVFLLARFLMRHLVLTAGFFSGFLRDCHSFVI
jgi:hypothetical protein